MTPPPFRVGDAVLFQFSRQDTLGTIQEDRGCIGVGGRRLYGIRFDLGDDDPAYLELPAEKLRPAEQDATAA